MTLVHGHHGKAAMSASARARRTHHSKKVDQTKRAELPKRKTSYKVVYEEIDEDKKEKKLRTLLYTEQRAPPGYTFIPAGDPQITNRCKQEAMDDGLTVYIVSSANDKGNGIAVQVHRLGYHFPSVSVEKACQSLGVSLTASGHVSQSRLAPSDLGVAISTSSNRQPAKSKKKTKQQQEAPKYNMTNLTQAVIDTQAREAIKDLFPKIPLEDLHIVIGRSFQKGKNLVGTADSLTLVHRAQLAVLAHIRHCYTNYDLLLRHYQWGDARKMIEQICLDKIISWRGDEDDANKMDDILREVIVIDDDENDEDRKQKSAASLHDRSLRDNSLEIISADSLQTQAINYGNVDRKRRTGGFDSPDMDSGDPLPDSGQRPLYLQQQPQLNQYRLDQMVQHRHRRYEEALHRRRKDPEPIYIADGSEGLLSQDRAAVEALDFSSYLRSQEMHSMEPRDRMAGALDYHNSQPMRATDNRVSLKETGQGGSEQVSSSLQSRKRKVACVLVNGWSPCKRSLIDAQKVAYPLQHYKSLPIRGSAHPALAQYSKEAAGHSHHSPQPKIAQHSSNAYSDGNERFARSKKSVYEANDATHPHSAAIWPRRSPNVALPSIEGGLASPTNQQTPPRKHTQQNAPFALVDVTHRVMPQSLVPANFHRSTYEEPPPGKKPKIDDQGYIESQNKERIVLIPLDDRNGYHAMRQRSAEAARDIRVQWQGLDKRIVQLPPRNAAAGSQDPQGHVQIVSHSGQTEDRSIHQLPHAHFQVPLTSAEARGQPQSLLSSDAGQSVYGRQSPSSFSASETAPSYREVHEFRPFSPHASGNVGSGERAFASSRPVVERLQRFDDAGREVRNDLRDLTIDDRHSRDHDSDMAGDLAARRVVYAPEQAAPANLYGFSGPQEDVYMERRQEHTLRARVDMLPQSGSNQYQPIAYNQLYQPGDRRNERAVQYIPMQVGQKSADPFDRRLPRSVPLSDAQPWSDLRLSSSWLSPADPLLSRNFDTGHQDRPLYMREDDRVSSTNGRLENGRPIHHDYEDHRRLSRRAPEDVIVLSD